MRFYRIKGFTLIEVLATVAILGVLATLVFAGMQGLIQRAFTSQELSAGRTLAAAYLSAAADNDGVLLAGYDESASGMTMPDGARVSAAAAHRYPFRLAPYFNYAINGAILLKENSAQIQALDSARRDYMASLYPALGMNLTYVGGEYRTGDDADSMEEECATRLGQVAKPSQMLVFASAARKNGDMTVDGYFELVPPNKRVTLWTGGDTIDKSNPDPESYGNVSFRHNGLAVCVFLDGSVRMLGPSELRDMRYWNKNAQADDNANYTVSIKGNQSGNKYR